MTIRKITSCVGVFSACLAISSAAIAEDNCSGYSISADSAHVLISDDHTLPFHLVTGECHVIGSNSSECKWTDEDGDQWTEVSEWKGPGTEGTSRVISGTGKYTKALAGRSRWKRVRSGPINVSVWGGYCPLADK